MSKKFKILLEYIKDLSIETPDAETLIFVKENIGNYQMNIDIKNNFLVGGNISNNPIKSVAKPGSINRSAAKAKAAPEIIS